MYEIELCEAQGGLLSSCHKLNCWNSYSMSDFELYACQGALLSSCQKLKGPMLCFEKVSWLHQLTAPCAMQETTRFRLATGTRKKFSQTIHVNTVGECFPASKHVVSVSACICIHPTASCLPALRQSVHPGMCLKAHQLGIARQHGHLHVGAALALRSACLQGQRAE